MLNPAPLFPRRRTRRLNLGGIAIGDGAPISIQSMTNSKTADVAGSLAQLQALAAAGCDIARMTVNDEAAAAALPAIIANKPLPLVADIHFDYRLALAAVEAGIDGLRINPGNIGSQQKVREVAAACKAAGIPIRIGVNGGSLEKELRQRYGGVCAEALVESALRHADMLEQEGFTDIKISLKSSDLPTTIAACRLLAEKTDYPQHIGITEAGVAERGRLKSAMGLAALLADGIGDTLRVSLSGEPVQEVHLAKQILADLGLRPAGWNFVSCPTCGRTDIDVEGIALEVQRRLKDVEPKRPRTIAVMGCVVNGPGEAQEADLGLAGGKGCGLLFAKGETIGKFTEAQLVDELIARALVLAEEE